MEIIEWNSNRWLAGTKMLSDAAYRCYQELLFYQYSHGYIPKTDRLRRRLCGRGDEEWNEIWHELQRENRKFSQVRVGDLIDYDPQKHDSPDEMVFVQPVAHEQRERKLAPKRKKLTQEETDNLIIREKKFVVAWNNLEGVRKNRSETLSATNRTKFQTRMTETKAWATNCSEAFKKFPLPCFDRNWKPTIEWFLRPDTVSNILEDHYDWNLESGGHPVESEAAAARKKEDEERKLAAHQRALETKRRLEAGE